MHVYKKIDILSENRKKLFWFLVVALAGFLSLYWIFIGLTVFRVAGAHEAERDFDKLVASVSELEIDYIAAISDVTVEESEILGFVEPLQVTYVNKRTFGQVAVRNNQF